MLVRAHASDLSSYKASGCAPPPLQAPFYLVVETSGSNSEHDNAKLDAFLEDAMGTGIVVDGTIAQGSSQAAAIWSLRESISDGLRQAGANKSSAAAWNLQRSYVVAV